MKFSELDSQMRVFETSHDHCVLPGMWVAARIDGRSFTRLTKETLKLERPYDIKMHEWMVATVRHLIEDSGFCVVYGYTQSDEISLLFHYEEKTFGRKLRKFNSVLAGEASACFTLLSGVHACFDCRVIQLPSIQHVEDYFRWRHADSHRNALSSHCYWLLREKFCFSAREATARLSGMTMSEKNELLFQRGINYNDLPLWQRRGTGLYWETYSKEATNPVTGQAVVADRRRIKVDYALPKGDDYGEMIRCLAEGKYNA